MTFAFLFLSLFFSHTFKKKRNCFPYPIWQNFISPFKEGGGIEGGRVENYVYSFKNLFNILLFFCVVLEHFDFFEYYYSCLTCLIQFFANSELPFSWTNKTQTGKKFHPLIKWKIANAYENVLNQPNKRKAQFFRSQNFGVVYDIDYTLQKTLLNHILH